MADAAKLARLKPWPKGVGGGGGGRPKAYGRIRKRFNLALEGLTPGAQRSIADVIIAHALDDNSPKQTQAWNIVISYGLGSAPKNLDDETVIRLAEEMVAKMIERAKERAAQPKAIDVEAK